METGEQNPTKDKELVGVEDKPKGPTDTLVPDDDNDNANAVTLASEETVQEDEVDRDNLVELGDKVLILASEGKYKRLTGYVYYRSGEEIHILPDGKSNAVEIIQLDEEGDPLEEYKITDIQILQKRPKKDDYAFVELIDIHEGDLVETFDEEGESSTKFIAGKVSEVNDSVELRVLDDPDAKFETFEFDFMGIRPEYGFRVMFPSELKKEEPAVPEKPAVEEEEDEAAPVVPPTSQGETIFEFTDEEVDLPVAQTLDEIKGYLERPSNKAQQDDMFEDLMKKYGEAGKRNPRIKRQQKILMNSLYQLRNSLVSYNATGDVAGYIVTSIETLGELLTETSFPMARPVVETSRVLHLDHTPAHFDNASHSDPTSISDPNIEIRYIDDVVNSMVEFEKTAWELPEGTARPDDDVKTIKDMLPDWYAKWGSFFDQLMTTLPLVGQGFEKVEQDYDVFRGSFPVGKTTTPGGKVLEPDATLPGLPILKSGADKLVTTLAIDTVTSSRLRALRSFMVRYGPQNRLGISEKADVLNVIAYILFPIYFLREFGSIRSGRLANDIGLSMQPLMTTRDVIDTAGPITEAPESNSILAVKPQGTLVSTVKIADWLSQQNIFARGVGDFIPIFSSLGVMEKEYTVDQMKVIVDKVNTYRAAIKVFLNAEREKAAAEAANTSVQLDTVLTSKDITELFLKITQEPSLQAALTVLSQRIPLYKESDVARFSFLHKQFQDLLLATIAQVPAPLVRERERIVGDLVLTNFRLSQRLKEKEEMKGIRPVPNECYHVSDLNDIHKVKDENQRLKLMDELITRYRAPGKRDHWLWCVACNGHLMCEHEFLQVQEIMFPREAANLHKELLLNFSDGVFQGKYICKNCGQGIAELEYDTSLEFDDAGNPLMGRSELVDKDEVALEEIKLRLGPKTEGTEQMDFGDEEKNKIYFTIRQIAELTGVFPTDDGYKDMVDFVFRELQAQPSQERYAAIQKAQQKADAEAKKEGKSVPTRQKIDYPVYISRFLVSACGAAFLIHVQTKVPDYVVRYTLPGCKFPEFTGYPLSGKLEDKETNYGIEYISCAIASIKRMESPWKDTLFLTIASDETRQKTVAFNITRWITEFTTKRTEVQLLLQKKKEYLLNTFGKEAMEGRPRDILPDGFMPQQVVLPKDKAALDPILASAAKGDTKAEAWILSAHALAREHAILLRGAVPIVTTCCFETIQTPAGFWKGKSLPALLDKEPPKGYHGSLLRVPMTPRPMNPILGKMSPDSMFKLFTRVCYTGERVGYPHEPGYDWICPHCNFRFPSDPRLGGPVMGSDIGAEKVYETELGAYNEALKASLDQANVPYKNGEAFEKLLDEVHKRYMVPPVTGKRKVLANLDLLEHLAVIQPAPFDQYREVMIKTIEELRYVMTGSRAPGAEVAPEKKDKKPSLREFSDAYAELSEASRRLETLLEERIKRDNMAVFMRIFDATPQRIAEFLRANYLVVLQQIVMKIKTEPMKKVRASYRLGPEVAKDIRTFMSAHLEIVDTFSDKIFVGSFPEAKCKEAIEKLTVVLPLLQYAVRGNIIPGAKAGFADLIRVMLLGIFVELLNPNHMPPKHISQVKPSTSQKVTDNQTQTLLQLMVSLIQKTKMEKLDFTDEQIRETCEARAEQEKANRIQKIDRKSKALKELDKIQKSIGTGDYYIKENAIRSFDEEQYEKDKLEMEQSGVNRFAYLYSGGQVQIPQLGDDRDAGQGYDNANAEDLHDD